MLFVGVPLAITDSEVKAAIVRAGAGALAAEGFAGAVFCTKSDCLSGGGVFFDAGLRLAAAFFAAGLLLMADFFSTVFLPGAAFFAAFFLGVDGSRAACFFPRGFFFTDTRVVVFFFFEGALRGLTRALVDLAGRRAALLFLDRFFMGCWVWIEKLSRSE
jgi:hypothetical protein